MISPHYHHSLQVKTRRWFSWLVRFRGLTSKNNDEELEEIDLKDLDDPARRNMYGGLDQTWTADLKLNILAGEIKGKGRLTMEKLQMDEVHALNTTDAPHQT